MLHGPSPFGEGLEAICQYRAGAGGACPLFALNLEGALEYVVYCYMGYVRIGHVKSVCPDTRVRDLQKADLT